MSGRGGLTRLRGYEQPSGFWKWGEKRKNRKWRFKKKRRSNCWSLGACLHVSIATSGAGLRSGWHHTWSETLLVDKCMCPENQLNDIAGAKGERKGDLSRWGEKNTHRNFIILGCMWVCACTCVCRYHKFPHALPAPYRGLAHPKIIIIMIIQRQYHLTHNNTNRQLVDDTSI